MRRPLLARRRDHEFMAMHTSFPLVAVDIGNSRIKLGLFDWPPSDGLPQPREVAALDSHWTPADWQSWLVRVPANAAWRIASVERRALARLIGALNAGAAGDVRTLCHGELPLAIDVPAPQAVGMDRLVNAVAANCLRGHARPAIVCDIGSAITVDAVAADGRFLGGAILPGIGMSARALHEFTDLLPLEGITELADPPPPVGNATGPAIQSGLYWGAVGAIRELVERMGRELKDAPEVFLTGGAAPAVAGLLEGRSESPVRFIPHLTLSGIAWAAAHAP